MKPYSILRVVLILMILVSFDSAFAQVGTKEMPRKDEKSPSQKKAEGARWRNPFLLPWGVSLLSEQGETPVRKEKGTGHDAKSEEMENAPLKVKAILISDQIRLATIGPHIVAVGDKVEGETILEIRNDVVILGKGDKKRSVRLHQGLFP